MPQVVTYCRVSSDEQAQKDISIPAQRKALHRWVDDQPELSVVEDFVDEGESAYAPANKRPGFCRMIAYCRKNPVSFILVHKLDRFSRNREESIMFKSLLRRHNVQVRSITETFDPETPQGFLYEGMIEVINQFYSMNLGTETLKGMRENAERGHFNGGRVPYGYRLERVSTPGGQKHSKLVPGPEDEVAVVREIFDLSCNQGMGQRAIANRLNQRGVRAPRGRNWSNSSIGNILRNRSYIGETVWNRSRKVGRDGREELPEDRWIVVKDSHEGIVDREIFERRQELAKKRGFRKPRSKARHVNYLLSRLIRCDCCGNNFSGRRGIRKARKGGTATDIYHYYCSGYLNQGRSVCRPFPLDRDWAEGLVLDLIRARLCAPEALAELERKVRERLDARRRAWASDPKVIEQKLGDIDHRIGNYYRAIGDGLDPAVCRQHIAELQVKRQALEEEADAVRKESYYEQAIEKNLAQLRHFADTFHQGFAELPFGVQRQVVLHFVEQMEMKGRKELHITLKVPFDDNGVKLLQEGGEGGLGGPAGDGVDTVGKPMLPAVSVPRLSEPLRGAVRFLVAKPEAGVFDPVGHLGATLRDRDLLDEPIQGVPALVEGALPPGQEHGLAESSGVDLVHAGEHATGR